MESEQPDIVSLTIAAERLDLSTEAVRKRIQRGTLPGRKVEGTWFVEASALPSSSSSGRPDVAAGRLDDNIHPSGPQLDEDQESVRTPAGQPIVDLAPLAEMIERLHGENQRLTEAATMWQVRARQAEDRLQALEAGPIAPPVAGDVHEHAPQDALSPHLQEEVHQETIQVPARHDTPEPTPETDERPWWRRLVDRF